MRLQESGAIPKVHFFVFLTFSVLANAPEFVSLIQLIEPKEEALGRRPSRLIGYRFHTFDRRSISG